MNCFVKERYETVWHFYHNSQGICFCKMNKDNIGEYSVLYPEGTEDFDVLIDDSDSLHMVCRNVGGDIVYINHSKGKWHKGVVTEAKNPVNYSRNISLERVNNWLNILYYTEYKGKKMITHRILESENLPPQVVDCAEGDFSTAKDSMGNIYILYYSVKNNCFGMKKFWWSQKRWTEFEPVEKLLGCKSSFLYIDCEDVLHIAYETDGVIWEYCSGEVKKIGTGQNPIICNNGLDFLMWEGISDNKIYIKNFDEDTPTVFMPGSFGKPIKFGLRYTGEERGIRAKYCFGNIVNGRVKTYGINDFFSTIKRPEENVVEDVKNGAGAGVDLELNKRIAEIQSRLERLSFAVESIMSVMAEADYKEINRQLQDIQSAVNKKPKQKLFNIF